MQGEAGREREWQFNDRKLGPHALIRRDLIPIRERTQKILSFFTATVQTENPVLLFRNPVFLSQHAASMSTHHS